MNKPFFFMSGMHRSGTSFLAKYMKTCGVYLGMNLESYKNIETENLEGNWENSEFLQVSEELLKSNEGSWDKPPSNIKISKSLSAKFKKIFSKLAEEAPLAPGVKDPRLILFIEKILHLLPHESIIIGIYRNPLKAAESLKIRNGFNYEKSLSLWYIYNKKLLERVKDGNVFLLSFDWPHDKLFLELEKIVKKTNLNYFKPDEIFKNDLIHSDFQYDKSFKLSENVQGLYLELEKYSQLNDSVNIKGIKNTEDDLKSIIKKMCVENTKLSSRIVELIRENKSYVSKLEADIENKTSELSTSKSYVSKLEADIENKTSELSTSKPYVSKLESENSQYLEKLNIHEQNRRKYFSSRL